MRLSVFAVLKLVFNFCPEAELFKSSYFSFAFCLLSLVSSSAAFLSALHLEFFISIESQGTPLVVRKCHYLASKDFECIRFD